MLVRAFPRLEPRAELVWMDQRQHESTEDLRYCQSLCALIEAVQTQGVVAEAPVKFHVRGTNVMHICDSPWYAVASRVLHASRQYIQLEWKLLPEEEEKTLHKFLGVVTRVLEKAPCLAKMRKDLPATVDGLEAMQHTLRLAIEWRIQLTAAHASRVPLNTPPGTDKRNNWIMWRLVLTGMIARKNGHYSDAFKLFGRAVYVHDWTPTPSVQNFMDAPRAEFSDAPVRAVAVEEEGHVPAHRGICPLSVSTPFK
jgi:hypothetical protein